MSPLARKPNTTIVVVCWNAIEYTKLTLECLSETIHQPYNLIIVDNHSSDGTQSYIKKLIKPNNCGRFKVILNRNNLGYGGAINMGYKQSLAFGSKYICVCNNDLYFQDHWIEKLEIEMEKNEDIGILGTLRPAVNYKHYSKAISTKQVVDSSPKELEPMDELNYFLDGLTFERGAQRLIEINGGGLEYINCPPSAVITCCALIRNAAIKKIGELADSRFKTYGSEDIDLSWSVAKHGYRCAVLKNVYVHHFRHKSIDSSKLDRLKYLKKNNNIFFNKWSKYLYKFLTEAQDQKIDLKEILNDETNYEYWILRRLNDNIHFWDGRKLVMSKFNEKGI